MGATRSLAVAVAIAAIAGCKKGGSDPDLDPAPLPATPVATPGPEAAPPTPRSAAPAGALKTPWGEHIPDGHRHPDGDWVSVFDLGGIYDLAVRGLPAINGEGDIAIASSVTLGEMDWSTLSVVIAGPTGEVRGRVVIFDADADGARRDEPPPIDEIRARARRANAMLAESTWRPMIELESTGTLEAAREQKLASSDGSATATFNEPRLVVTIDGETLAVDGRAWSRRACPGDPSETGNVLLSGVWIDPPTGSVVARVGYEGKSGCSNDPIFAIARARPTVTR
jgi:hypothetical protein